MNYKQKLGYMVLGAAMPLVGMAVSIFFPSLNAQKRGEYIVYAGLTVVDGKGNDAIRFTVGENRNLIVVYDKKGKRAIGLHTGETGTGIIVFDKAGNAAIGLGFDETRGNEIRLSDKAGGAAIGLRADQTINRISVYDKTGKKRG